MNNVCPSSGVADWRGRLFFDVVEPDKDVSCVCVLCKGGLKGTQNSDEQEDKRVTSHRIPRGDHLSLTWSFIATRAAISNRMH